MGNSLFHTVSGKGVLMPFFFIFHLLTSSFLVENKFPFSDNKRFWMIFRFSKPDEFKFDVDDEMMVIGKSFFVSVKSFFDKNLLNDTGKISEFFLMFTNATEYRNINHVIKIKLLPSVEKKPKISHYKKASLFV